MKGSNRWPPIFALGLTALLVFAVLPNPLRIPQNNPAAQAEYAPVPGEQQNSENANFGETGQAESGGIGSGGREDPDAINLPPIEVPPVFVPSHKRCSGSPALQTEDPLSPPCVPGFSASNGGSTYKQGVTETEILIVFYNDLGVEGDLNQPYSVDQEAAGHESSQNNQQTYLVRTIKALFNFYQQRYQTYNRRVHMIAVASGAGITSECSQRKVEAAVINDEYKPFAVVHFGDGGQCFLNEMGNFGVPGFGLNSDVPRSEFRTFDYEGKDIGMAWGFYPDQESMAAWSASFICRKLRGRPARFAGNSSATPDTPPAEQGPSQLKDRTRKFGLIYPRESQRGPESAQMASLLISELEGQCGITPDASGNGELYIKTIKDHGQTEAPSYMSDFKQKNVTTVICYCVPVQSELTVTAMQQSATGLEYFPEWYWDHTSRMFRAVWNRQHGSPAHVSFGTSYHWRNPRFEEQFWYKSFKAIDPSGEPNRRFGFDIYHLFLNLFQGIQGAGPDLNPETIQRGMFTFKYFGDTDKDDLPSGYYDDGDYERPFGGYGSDHFRAVSTYTFIDTGFAWWWDPTGQTPGKSEPDGCLRAVNQGRRYHAGFWPEGDTDLMLKGSSSPCFQDDTDISKTSTIF
jgi:hypothetical protein